MMISSLEIFTRCSWRNTNKFYHCSHKKCTKWRILHICGDS